MAVDFGPSPIARRTAWLVERYAADDLTEADVRQAFTDELTADDWRRNFQSFRRPIDRVGAYTEISSVRAEVSVVCEGRPATIRTLVTDDAEARLRAGPLMLDPAAGVTVRTATADDAAALAALERRCPVIAGDVAVTYDRGDDYFAQHRLMGETYTVLAEYEGRVVGTFSDAIRLLRVAGIDYLTTYRCYLRVDPECRGMAIMPGMNGHQGFELMVSQPRRPLVTMFEAVGNVDMAAMRGTKPHGGVWSEPVHRIVVDCAGQAGDASVGRPATPDDAAHVATLLDALRGKEECAPVFDADHVRARLARSPSDYGWSDLLVTDGAVVGVWNQRLTVTKRRGDDVERAVRAVALDWGCLPGAEAELRALVGAWCARLAAAGTTHLSLYSSPGARGRSLLDELEPTVEHYTATVLIPEPPDLALRGLHVDPIWF